MASFPGQKAYAIPIFIPPPPPPGPVSTITFNPSLNVPDNGGVWVPPGQLSTARNWRSLSTSVLNTNPGDVHKAFALNTFNSSQANPYPVADRYNILNKLGTLSAPITFVIAAGSYLMLDMALALGTTSLNNATAGQSLLHVEGSNFIFMDFRDQTQSAAFDYSSPLNPYTCWGLTVGNRQTWLNGATTYYNSFAGNTTTQANIRSGAQTAFFYRHNQSHVAINSKNCVLNGVQLNGAANFTASFTAANCSDWEYHGVESACHGLNNGQGDGWQHQGVNSKFEYCVSHHCSHQNHSFETVNGVVRFCDFGGYWGDVPTGWDGDTYAGGNISAGRARKRLPPLPVPPTPVPASTSFGRTLREYSSLVHTGLSTELSQGYPYTKNEGYGGLDRFNSFALHRASPTGYHAHGSSYEPNTGLDLHLCKVASRQAIIHNSYSGTNGFWLYEESEVTNVAWVPQDLGGGHTWLNNALRNMGDPSSQNPWGVINNIGHSIGLGSYADINRNNRCQGNLWGYIGGGTGNGNKSIAWSSTTTNQIWLLDAVVFNGLWNFNTFYNPNLVNDASLTRIILPTLANPNPNQTVLQRLAAMLLDPAHNTLGIGDAVPLSTVTADSTGAFVQVDDALPWYDGQGFATETPDVAAIYPGGNLSSSPAVIQILPGTPASPSVDIVNNILHFATTLTVHRGDTLFYVPRGMTSAWLNRGIPPVFG